LGDTAVDGLVGMFLKDGLARSAEVQ